MALRELSAKFKEILFPGRLAQGTLVWASTASCLSAGALLRFTLRTPFSSTGLFNLLSPVFHYIGSRRVADLRRVGYTLELALKRIYDVRIAALFLFIILPLATDYVLLRHRLVPRFSNPF